jgi:phthalate 4,5-cis-dihydrodiol dehydrogenase
LIILLYQSTFEIKRDSSRAHSGLSEHSGRGKKMPEGQVRMGVAGLGRGFMLTLPALLGNPNISLVAAADPRLEARNRFTEEIGGRAYRDVAALCADAEVDAVYIASPHEYHAAQAILALRAGKHVLVEKPMATSIEDCKAMTEAARDAGTALIVGPSHGFDAPVRLAASLIADGHYGRPRMITALNFTDYIYRPRRPEEFDSVYGGGVVFAQAVHQIDVVRRLADDIVIGVRARTGDWDTTRSTEGAYAAFITFAGGAVASLTYSGYGRYDSDELCDWISETGYPKNPAAYGEARRNLAAGAGTDESVLKLRRAYGDKGIGSLPEAPPFHEHFGFVIVSCDHADLRLTPSGLVVHGRDERQAFKLEPPAIPRAEVIEELVQSVLGGIHPSHDGEWGTDTIACCLALLRSSREGREILLDS